MNGIWVEDQHKESFGVVIGFDYNSSDNEICITAITIDEIDWDVAYYSNDETFNCVWSMLETAIATGVRLFRFPTQEEIEKEMQECD